MIFIVAGNYQQFRAWCLDNHRSPQDPKITFISEGAAPRYLYGTRDPQVLWYGTWQQRKDINEIIECVRLRYLPTGNKPCLPA